MVKSNQSSMRLWQIFLQRSLGLANVLNKKISVIHRGLFSSDDVKLSDIRAIDRFREPPDEGMVCHLVSLIGVFSGLLSVNNFNQSEQFFFLNQAYSPPILLPH